MAKVENGLNFARYAASKVEALVSNMLAASSSARLESWNHRAIFRKYFGGHPYQEKWYFIYNDNYRVFVLKRIRNIAEDCRLATQHFRKIRRQLNGCNKKCKKDRTAYTRAEFKHRVYLCPDFFREDRLKTPCRVARLLLHEFGHKDGIIGDPVYGRAESIALAAQDDHNFTIAGRNADNYAYFFINMVMDPFLAKSSTDDAKWCTPWVPTDEGIPG